MTIFLILFVYFVVAGLVTGGIYIADNRGLWPFISDWSHQVSGTMAVCFGIFWPILAPFASGIIATNLIIKEAKKNNKHSPGQD